MRLQKTLGFMVGLALTASIHAQNARPGTNPAERVPAQAGPMSAPLYQRGDVSKTLNLNAQQTEKLNQLNEQLQIRHRSDLDKLNSLVGPDRAAQEAALNQRYADDWRKGATNIFTGDQLQRYQQLQYQYGGFSSLADPEVQKRLNLTEEQRKNLREGIDWSSKQLRDIDRTGAADREKGTQLYQDYRREYQQRFNKFLTPEQQTTWRQISGEPYSFQPTFTKPGERR